MHELDLLSIELCSIRVFNLFGNWQNSIQIMVFEYRLFIILPITLVDVNIWVFLFGSLSGLNIWLDCSEIDYEGV